MALIRPTHENQVRAKRVESSWFPCLDPGSNPGSSTKRLSGRFFYAFQNWYVSFVSLSVQTRINLLTALSVVVKEPDGSSSHNSAQAMVDTIEKCRQRNRLSELLNALSIICYFCPMTFAETEKTELKQRFADSLPKEIVAFLNTDGGTIYIGVNDDGSVCGVTSLDESLKKIADILESQILPDPRQFVELNTKYIEQKHVIEIKVQRGFDLYYIKKYGRSSQGCYIRVGSTSRSMTEQQINLAHNRYLDSKVKITEIASRIKNPTFQYLKLLLTEKGLNVNESTFAENFHLLTSGGQYNRMAELLADKNEVSIKVVRFKGKNKSDGIAIRNEYGEKCLVVAMKQAYDYCADVINETHTSFTNGVRNDKPLFDRDAFREVWFNACLHNNWADGTPPAIYIYTDRMEIISTGGLPANLSKDDFFRGVSKPVNEELARLFIRLDLMEQTGYGIPLVTERYSRNAFEFLDFFLRVTIPFAFEIEGDSAEGDSEKLHSKLHSKLHREIPKSAQRTFLAIAENPNATIEDLSKNLGISVRTVNNQIALLRGKFIQRVGSDKTGHWEIIKQE